MDKYAIIDVSSLIPSVSIPLNSIEACVDLYMGWWGDVYVLARYEVHPWNYCGYRAMGTSKLLEGVLEEKKREIIKEWIKSGKIEDI